MNATIISIYLDNIHPDVVEAQARCVQAFLPEGWKFWQHRYIPEPNKSYHHATALEYCLNAKENPNDITIFLDIDCIPLSKKALMYAAVCASMGRLAGAVQRANHIENNEHLYVGPFCMALSKSKYKELESPSFRETPRGDVGEELSYAWVESAKQHGKQVYDEIVFFFPSHVEKPMWKLIGNLRFGFGTTYGGVGIGSQGFYHAFCMRDGIMKDEFILKCEQVLEKEKKEKGCVSV